MQDITTNAISSLFAFTTSHQLLSIIIGIVLLLSTSGIVVRITFKKLGINLPQSDSEDKLYGIIFGKCENVIIYILVLLEGYTALALIYYW